MTRASIENPKIKSSFSDEFKVAKDPSLLLHFQIKNKDERKVLSFSNFDGSRFTLADDVQNGVDAMFWQYEWEGKFFGDINPEMSETHVQAYSVPLPKTKHLILTIDLSSCGGEGKIEFMIPAASIER